MTAVASPRRWQTSVEEFKMLKQNADEIEREFRERHNSEPYRRFMDAKKKETDAGKALKKATEDLLNAIRKPRNPDEPPLTEDIGLAFVFQAAEETFRSAKAYKEGMVTFGDGDDDRKKEDVIELERIADLAEKKGKITKEMASKALEIMMGTVSDNKEGEENKKVSGANKRSRKNK